MRIRRVLIVCTGNTCRSPMAAALLRQLWAKVAPGSELEVESAGTSAAIGASATEHAITALRDRGLDLSGHRSQIVAESVVSRADLVLTMTVRHKEQLRALWPAAADRVFTLGEFAGMSADVPDPFGGSLAEYTETAARLETMLAAVVERIRREGTQSSMKVAFGCDHGGIDLKEAVIGALKDLQLEYDDLGTYDRTSCDYPDFAQKVAEAVVAGRAQYGILVCGTGIGMSMAANKVQGIRAALCNEIFSAKMARAHNDANILCMGARVVGSGVAQEIVKAFFSSGFEGGRHARRVEKIGALEHGR